MRFRSGVAALGLLGACAGEAPALPPPPFGADSTSDSGDDPTGVVASSSSGEAQGQCGNGQIDDSDEECDGSDVAGATCESLGHIGGPLSCGLDCRYDYSDCGPLGMVQIPAGTFEMGSFFTEDEGPIRDVFLDTFYIDPTEVTVNEYASCQSCSPPDTGTLCNWGQQGRGLHPVNCVTWAQAAEFCAWTSGGNKRLPTEAEWEKAARGNFGRVYPWGDMPEPSCEYAVMDEDEGDGCGMNSTWVVGSKPGGASIFGVEDMAGNVMEWTMDWYGPYTDELVNPQGPSMGQTRALRGGSFFDALPESFRTANRYALDPDVQYTRVGFRCVLHPDDQ